jgi:hypothetical protein
LTTADLWLVGEPEPDPNALRRAMAAHPSALGSAVERRTARRLAEIRAGLRPAVRAEANRPDWAPDDVADLWPVELDDDLWHDTLGP